MRGIEYEKGRVYVGVGKVGSLRGGESDKTSENRPLFMFSFSCTNSSVGVCLLSLKSYILERVSAKTFLDPGACIMV